MGWHVDPHLMKIFRTKMMNPVCAHKVYRVLRSCNVYDLRTPERAYALVDRLSECCEMNICPQTRDYAANWLMKCGVDPAHPGHRRAMWNVVWGR